MRRLQLQPANTLRLGCEATELVSTCPWPALTGPAAGWGLRSGPGMLWWAEPAGLPSASASSLHSPSRSPLSSEWESMQSVCIFIPRVCVCALPGCSQSGCTPCEGFLTPEKLGNDCFTSKKHQHQLPNGVRACVRVCLTGVCPSID